MSRLSRFLGWSLLSLAAVSCTLRHRIEPSDKPLVVNLNVKIDHEIQVKIREQNEDLLNLEEQYIEKKSGG